jgi:hypothetical protein
MSTGFGMADGRMTNNMADRLYMAQLMADNNVDAKGFRQLVYTKGTSILGDPLKGFKEEPQPWLTAPQPYVMDRRQKE